MYPISLEIEGSRERVHMDLILTTLQDYSNFVQLKKRLDAGSQELVN